MSGTSTAAAPEPRQEARDPLQEERVRSDEEQAPGESEQLYVNNDMMEEITLQLQRLNEQNHKQQKKELEREVEMSDSDEEGSDAEVKS